MHEMEWNGRDHFNQPAGSGLYFVRIRAGKEQKLAKVILLK
jgi:hypothetical protein